MQWMLCYLHDTLHTGDVMVDGNVKIFMRRSRMADKNLNS